MGWTQERERYKAEICGILNRIGALKFGAFTLTSGKLSSYYVDLRVVPSFPNAYLKVCNAFIDMVKNDVGIDNFDRISGIPTAGVPFASVIAYTLQKPFLYTRSDTKVHGRGRRVEGILMPGDRVLVIDDLITTGKSVLDAVEAIATEGGVVKDVVVLIDREEGGRRALAKRGVSLRYLAKMSEVAKVLYERESLSEDQYRDIMRQIRSR